MAMAEEATTTMPRLRNAPALAATARTVTGAATTAPLQAVMHMGALGGAGAMHMGALGAAPAGAMATEPAMMATTHMGAVYAVTAGRSEATGTTRATAVAVTTAPATARTCSARNVEAGAMLRDTARVVKGVPPAASRRIAR